MLSAIGVCVVLSAAIFAYKAWIPRRTREASLGRMSSQWIAENRTSKTS
jgi:hypothetical protein